MGKRKKVAGALLLAVAVLGVAGNAVVSRLNQPVTAAVVEGKATSNFDYSIDMTPQTQTGQFASFDYPKGLHAQPPETPVAPVLQQNDYVGHDVRSWILAAGVATLPNGDLANNSSYQLRVKNPQTYLQSRVTTAGQTMIIFTDTTASGFGKVAFLPHGDKVGTVSLTGDDAAGANPLDTAFTMTLQSWHWR